TLTGYGLRFIRTTKYHDAVDCFFVKYENGKATPISEPVSTSAFKSVCDIVLEVKGAKIQAHVQTESTDHSPSDSAVVATVDLNASLIPSSLGGFGIEYAGGSPTLIKNLTVEWKE